MKEIHLTVDDDIYSSVLNFVEINFMVGSLEGDPAKEFSYLILKSMRKGVKEIHITSKTKKKKKLRKKAK